MPLEPGLTSLGLIFALTVIMPTRLANLVRRLRFFLLGCLMHSVVDILTHYDDGPLLLWPFDWTMRFQSPVSHWDPLHWGPYVLSAELLLNTAIATWLVARACRRAVAHSLPFAALADTGGRRT